MTFCCPEQKFYDEKKIFQRLRGIKDYEINMKLKSDVPGPKSNKNFECSFNQKEVKWNGNIDEIYNSTTYINEKDDEKIRELRQKIIEGELELDNLEKEYLAKTIRLLYMVQTHCDLKTDNEKLFNYYGIKTGNVSLSGTKELKPSEINSQKEDKKVEKVPLNT